MTLFPGQKRVTNLNPSINRLDKNLLFPLFAFFYSNIKHKIATKAFYPEKGKELFVLFCGLSGLLSLLYPVLSEFASGKSNRFLLPNISQQEKTDLLNLMSLHKKTLQEYQELYKKCESSIGRVQSSERSQILESDKKLLAEKIYRLFSF